MPKLSDCTLKYIRSRCEVDAGTGCWLFQHEVCDSSRFRHPQVYIQELKRPVLVRRLAWAAHKGVPLSALDGLFIVAKAMCRNPDCVNPNHARCLSKAQKVRFSLEKANAKGQFTKALKCALARRSGRGGSHPSQRVALSPEIVAEIRLLPNSGKDRVSDSELTRRLNARGIKVCRKSVSEARNGTTWKEYGTVFHQLRVA